ncbi:hypothetical protein K523DRAFT_161657 [Schizophyllum commune Tattone D]|nr:hypothetical protein K523DRAFT_161657 [Schizophyllum commune Tattone D]
MRQRELRMARKSRRTLAEYSWAWRWRKTPALAGTRREPASPKTMTLSKTGTTDPSVAPWRARRKRALGLGSELLVAPSNNCGRISSTYAYHVSFDARSLTSGSSCRSFTSSAFFTSTVLFGRFFIGRG